MVVLLLTARLQQLNNKTVKQKDMVKLANGCIADSQSGYNN